MTWGWVRQTSSAGGCGGPSSNPNTTLTLTPTLTLTLTPTLIPALALPLTRWLRGASNATLEGRVREYLEEEASD